MIKRLLLGLLAASTLGAWLIGNPATVGYRGPGDYTTFTAWYGLRAYSATVAAGGIQPSVDLRRASDNAACTALIATDGSLDLTVGTPCNGNTQTVTAWIGASSAFVSKIYDQTAGSACGGSCDLVPITTSRQPKLLLTGCGGGGALPCFEGVAVSPFSLGQTAANFTPDAGARFSMSAVGNRVSGTGGVNLISDNLTNLISAKGGTADAWSLAGTGSIAAAATDGSWHAANGVADGAGSVMNLDGTETAGTVTGNAAVNTATMGWSSLGTVVRSGEAGFADNAAWSSGVRAALCHNQRLYWGTGGSC